MVNFTEVEVILCQFQFYWLPKANYQINYSHNFRSRFVHAMNINVLQQRQGQFLYHFRH